MRKSVAVEQATKLAAAYPGRNIQVANVEAWADELMALEDEPMGRAVVRRLIANCANPPSVAELRECMDAELPYDFGNQGAPPPKALDDESISFGEWLRRNPDQEETARRVFPSWFKQQDREANISAQDIARRDLA